MKTIEEAEKEIGEIINNCYSVEDKLQKFQNVGYTVMGSLCVYKDVVLKSLLFSDTFY